ncbi:MAG: hypothetical protein U9R08_06385 [Nanoarchaeota archaeon]|nr:hypothetical protein [Nanoarchaeota archaeon]
MKKALFIRPSHDDVTSYLHHYSKELLKEADNKGFKTMNKEKDDATCAIVVSVIDKNDPEFIMFNGHGNTNLICGHKDEILIQKGVNHKLLKNKMIYSVSCSSAEDLGESVGDKKTTFIGYTEEFALGMDITCQTAVHRDKRAKLFLEPSNLLVKSILKGNSAKEAVAKAKSLMRENISKLRTDPFPDAKDYLPYLYNNYLVLDIKGNESATL